ncbi:NAD(P)-binding domain-containing protein [Deinococcus sp. UYEF24]
MSPDPADPLPALSSPGTAFKTDVVVIGAGQAGLSAAYHLQQLGLAPGRGYVVLDASAAPGGAWQYRWPTLTLSTVNRIHDLPGLAFAQALSADAAETDAPDAATQVQARVAVPRYFRAYEQQFRLPVYRPVKVNLVTARGPRLRIETDRGLFSARGVINATGTWDTPYVPVYPGADRFQGRQLHTHEYVGAAEFTGQHVVIVGGGISAIQLLDEISFVALTTWVTRRPPVFRSPPFGDAAGRQAVEAVEDRVRRGLTPTSVVGVTGLPLTPAVEAMRARGVLERLPMFDEITEHGVKWKTGAEVRADAILWCTGFRSSLDHLAPLALRGPEGGVVMTGRLATQVEKDPRIHLVGYGPSASTIGANRAGRAAASELLMFLQLP